MKILVNKKFKIGESEQSYAELVKACAMSIGKNGLPVDEQRKRFRLMDVLEKGGDNLSFEDADAALLKELVKGMPWAVCLREIVEFGDAVEKM